MDSPVGQRIALLSGSLHHHLRTWRRYWRRSQEDWKGRMSQVRTVRPRLAVPALGMDVRLATLEPEAAIERVTAALKTQGFGVLTRIDAHSTFQQKLGVSFRPYTFGGHATRNWRTGRSVTAAWSGFCFLAMSPSKPCRKGEVWYGSPTRRRWPEWVAWTVTLSSRS